MAKPKTVPDNGSIPSESQVCDQEQNQCEDEVATHRKLLEKDLSPSKRAEVLYDLAYALYNRGNLEEAIFCAEELLNTYPDYRYLGSVFWLLGVIYQDSANLPEYSENRGQNIAEAERNLGRALDHIDDKEERATILVELGVVLSSSDKLTDAQCAFEQALELGIEDPFLRSSCYQRLGRILYGLDEVEQAKQYSEQAVLVHPEQPNIFHSLAYIDLAILYREQGDIARAERYCQQARYAVDKSDPNAASIALGSIYEELGDISFEKAEYQQAADNYQAAMEHFQLPEKQDKLGYKLSVALRWDGQYKRAFEALRQSLTLALSSQPTDEGHIGELLVHMGECAYSLYDIHQATVLFEKATEKVKPPMLAEVHLSLGHSYFQLKRYGEAMECYRKTIVQARFLSPSWRQAVRYYIWARIAR